MALSYGITPKMCRKQLKVGNYTAEVILRYLQLICKVIVGTCPKPIGFFSAMPPVRFIDLRKIPARYQPGKVEKSSSRLGMIAILTQWQRIKRSLAKRFPHAAGSKCFVLGNLSHHCRDTHRREFPDDFRLNSTTAVTPIAVNFRMTSA